METGGSLPCVLNAADEVAVEAFLTKRIKFLQIPELIERVLDASSPVPLRSIDDVLDCDKRARIYAETVLARMTAKRKPPNSIISPRRGKRPSSCITSPPIVSYSSSLRSQSK